jgi:glycosyltransferase involved in cell wall biosynthesis
MRIARGTFDRTPFQTLANSDELFRKEALRLIDELDIDIAHVQLVRMAPVLQGVQVPRFMDFMDALSVNMRQLAEHSRGPKKLVAKVESVRLTAYEQLILQEYHAGGITAWRDRKAMGDPDKIFVIPQGVPLLEGCPEQLPRPEARIVFSGRMSYFPNVEAACWFANEIFPLIRLKVPSAEFVIAGADPKPKVKALNELPGVTVSGFVKSITDELLGSTIAVAPMKSGTGMQTKVLEAVAAGTPVVLTSEGLGNICLEDGIHVSVADNAEQFAQAVIRLLKDKEKATQQASKARKRVEEFYSWKASNEELLKGYEYAREAFERETKLGVRN